MSMKDRSDRRQRQTYETEPLRDSVAIIGVGGIFPKAHNAKAFWKNVLNRVDCISEVPIDRWDPSIFYDPDHSAPDKSYSKVGGFVTHFIFDPLRFRIPPNVSKNLEPVQQRILVATQEALEDAGFDKKHSDHSRTAVVFGTGGPGEKSHDGNRRVWFNEQASILRQTDEFRSLPAETQQAIIDGYERKYKSRLAPITEDSMPGELGNIVAGRVSNIFDFGGTNLTVDAACASSHAAFDVAIKGLTTLQYDTVLTGGASMTMDPTWYVKFSKIGALSASGKSRPFDDKADGFVMGEGVCVMVLKRLVDAIREHDKIYAVVRAVGSSSDGKGKGITAPKPAGQVLAIKRAMDAARLSPRHIQLIEAHATSTPTGDVAEMSAYALAFAGQVLPPKSIAVGSVKSQIGHLQTAAGAAGILKAALALYHKVLPPTINLETLNTQIPWDKLPFYVNTETEPWPDTPNGEPRRAGVSAFGFGGINFHIILEEYVHDYHDRLLDEENELTPHVQPVQPIVQPKLPSIAAPGQEEIILVTANSLNDLEAAADEVLRKVSTATSFHEFAEETRLRSNRKVARAAIIASSFEELQRKLQGLDVLLRTPKLALPSPKGIFIGEGSPAKLGILFPGQGSQYANMFMDLAENFSIVRQTFNEGDQVLTKVLGRSLTSMIFVDPKDPAAVARSEEYLRKTEYTQPAMLVADIALYRLLSQWGIVPNVVAGHSLGEYAALVAGGVLSFEDAVVVVAGRAREIMRGAKVQDFGKMAAISATKEKVEEVLKGIEGYVIAANNNSPKQTVIAGKSSAVVAACEKFDLQGIDAKPLNVSAAFHSAIVEPAQEPFGRILNKTELHSPELEIYSNVTGEPYSANTEDIKNLLVKQIASPVQWQKTIENMYRDGVRVFLEVGPKGALTTITSQVLEAKSDAVCYFTNHPKRGQILSLKEAIAHLLAIGFDVDIDQPQQARPIRDKEVGDLPPDVEKTKAETLSVTPPAARKLDEEIKNRLISIVARKTGYPTEMLQTDLDMEADLGIDTVKQGEIIADLRQEYKLPRENDFRLKDYPTLNHVIDYLSTRLSKIDIPTPAIVEFQRDKSQPHPETAQVTAPTAQADNILREIQSLYAAKTGYPMDVLDPTVDLEADLGIDTVKQTELFALIREKYGIPRIEKLKMKDFPNLNSIALFVKEHGTEPLSTKAQPITQAIARVQPELSTRRLTPRIVPWPIQKKIDFAVLQDRSFIITMDRGGIAQSVAATLRLHGARVFEAQADRVLKEAEKVADECRREGYLNGIVHVAPLDLIGGPYDFDEADSERLSSIHGKSLFLLAKNLVSDLKDGCVLSVTSMGGSHGIKPEKSNWSPLSGAVTGLTKALAREFPQLHVRSLDTSTSVPADSRAAAIIEELVDLLSSESNNPLEIGRLPNQRVAVRTLLEQNFTESQTVPITEGLPIVVSGGGRGITPEILKALLSSKPLNALANSKIQLVILGRTVLSDDVEELANLNEAELAAVKQQTANELKSRGERVTPISVERAFEPTSKAIAIHNNLEAFRKLGADVTYVQCDVSDESALKSALNEIKLRYGPIGGVLHAAGTDESKRLSDKTSDSWDRVFNGKALGAIGLARLTRDQPLRFFIMFGSIAGRFGNSAQADYCAASDLLAKLAHSLRALGVPASTYDWSAWKTVGMATKGSVLKVLGQSGVEPLSIEDGVQLFLKEFSSGQEPEIVLAKTLGNMEETESSEVSVNETSNGFLAGAKTALVRGVSASTERTLSRANDRFLEDHCIEGVAYLPGVFSIESFIENSKSLVPHLALSEICDVSFAYAVKVFDRPVNFQIRSEIYKTGTHEVDVRSQLVTPSIDRLFGRVNASAVLRFSVGTQSNSDHGHRKPQPLTSCKMTRLYPPLFHGPSLQILTRIEALGPRGLIVHARVPKPSLISEFSNNRIPELEAAAQAVGLWGLMINNRNALYHGISSATRICSPEAPLNNEFTLEVRNGHFDGKIVRCDVDVMTVHGELIMHLIGLELIPIDMSVQGEFRDLIPFPYEVSTAADRNIYRVPIQWVSEALAEAEVFNDLLHPEEKREFAVLSGSPLKRRAEWMAGTLAAKAALRATARQPLNEQAWSKLAIHRDTRTGKAPTVDGLWQVTITHAGKWAAALAYNSGIEQVGVDIEIIEDRPPTFVEEAFSAQERIILRNPRDITRAWCIKEAVLKALRVGLREDLHQVSVNLSTTPPKAELIDRLRMTAGNIAIHEIRLDDQHVGAIAIIANSSKANGELSNITSTDPN